MGLAACAPQAPPGVFGFPPAAPGGLPPGPSGAPRSRVGLLLPLSGAQAPLGRAMLNASQLALFEQGDARMEFVPRDTGGGAEAAARAATGEGARVLAGPLTAADTRAVAPAARAARVPVLALTNDSAAAGGGVWTLGATPGQQVRRVTAAAAAQGARRFGAVVPDDEFGRRLAAALRGAASDLNLPPPAIATHPARGPVEGAARDLLAGAPAGLDAVLIGEAGERARAVAAALATASGGGGPPPRLLGHALWAADPPPGPDSPLAGALFAAPDPAARAAFEGRYQEAFGERPPRLAGVAYDAAGLAARALRQAGPPGAPVQPATGEVFLGADGPVRLLPDGQVARGLAVFEVVPGDQPRLVEPSALPLGPGA